MGQCRSGGLGIAGDFDLTTATVKGKEPSRRSWKSPRPPAPRGIVPALKTLQQDRDTERESLESARSARAAVQDSDNL